MKRVELIASQLADKDVLHDVLAKTLFTNYAICTVETQIQNPEGEVLAKHRAFGYTGINDEGRWHLTPKGYLLSNTIISDLLVAQDESHPLRRL